MDKIDSEFIRKLRWELGLSQRDLAKKLGVTPGSVGQWESSMTKPGRRNQEKLKKIALRIKDNLDGSWEKRVIMFRLARESDSFSIPLGKGDGQLVPMITVTFSTMIKLLTPDDKGELVINPRYESCLKFFRDKVDSMDLKMNQDYEFGSVGPEVFITPLHQAAWETLKPWKLSNEEVLKLWNERETG